MVKEVIPADTTACKTFETLLMVGNPPTIPPHGDPCLLDNISVQNHGELNSRETCRLLRPTKEKLNLPSFKCFTNTTPSMTRMVSQPSSTDKMNFHQNSLGSLQVNVQQQQVTSSYQMSDELNTPDISGTTFEFPYGTMPNCDTSCSSAAATDLIMDSEWGPAPFTHAPVSELLNTVPVTQPAPQRPAQLTLTLQANYYGAGSTPTLNVDTPNVVLNTPDVLQSLNLDGNGHFDLVNFITGSSSNTPIFDCQSPQQRSNITKTRGQKAATTSNREQLFVQEEKKLAIHEEFPFINPVIKPDPEPEVIYDKTESQYEYSVVKQEYCPDVSSTIPSPVQELAVTPMQVQDCNVTSRKRSSRLISKESTSTQPRYFDGSESDEDPTPKRPRRNSSVMSNVSYGHSVGKSEYTNDHDDSSIAGSAAESRYKDLREKNNDASRRSRQNRRKKENEMETKKSHLESENKRLQSKHDALQKCVLQMRQILLNNARCAKKNT